MNDATRIRERLRLIVRAANHVAGDARTPAVAAAQYTRVRTLHNAVAKLLTFDDDVLVACVTEEHLAEMEGMFTVAEHGRAKGCA